MNAAQETHCIAFEGYRCIASGPLSTVALKVKEVTDRGPNAPVLVFDEVTSQPIELDLRGTAEDILQRLAASSTETTPSVPPEPAADEKRRRGPGRPKLGVVSREITLLPRHWAWLAEQPGKASVTLRKLVEQALRANAGKDRLRKAQESAYRFLSAIAGNLPDFEEATRALFAGDPKRFDTLVEPWPGDIRDHARRLAATAFRSLSEASNTG